MENVNHLEALQLYAGALKNEGFESHLLNVTEQTPYETLLIALPMEGHPRGGLQMELSFMPGMEAQLDGLSILQCLVPIEEIKANEAELQATITNINKFCTLVGFGILSNPHIVYFRHTAMLPADPQQNLQLITQTTWLISYLLEMFGPGLSQIADGSSTTANAFSGHQFEHLITQDSAVM